MPEVIETKSKTNFRKDIKSFAQRQFNNFRDWLKPDPAEHWLLQVLKLAAKLPLVILLIISSPVLLLVFMLIFLLAL